MKKSIFFVAALALFSFVANAQWDGNVFTDGCQAISQNDPSIISWAKGVEVIRGTQAPGVEELVTYGKAYDAVGLPDSTVFKCVSLGEGGMALITFDRPIINGQGKDFVVFENAFSPVFLELAFVEVSSDGEHFFRFPAQTTSANSTEGREATHYNNLAGKYELGWGVGFDLDELAEDENLDKMNIRYVRLVDVVDAVSTDVDGNIIYDGFNLAPSYSAGFDLAGIGVINGGTPYMIADFENGDWLSVANTYEITDMTNYTSELEGKYYREHESAGLVFPGVAFESWGYMMAIGFGASNISSPDSASGNGYSNEYYISSALSGVEGMNSTYMQAYYSEWDASTLKHNNVYAANDSVFFPQGVYVSQSLASYNYIAEQMQETGYLSLIATGYDAQGNQTASVTYTLSNGTENIADWRFMDLTALGEVKEVVFTMASNYGNEYGMLVPAYFCLDNFVYKTTNARDTLPDSGMEDVEMLSANIYPNPATSFVKVELNNQTSATMQVYDMQGRMLLNQAINGTATINTANMQGAYIVRIIANEKVLNRKLIVR